MKAQTIDEGTDQNLDLLLCSIPYADQENFVRGVQLRQRFFFVDEGGEDSYTTKMGHNRPASVSLAGR